LIGKDESLGLRVMRERAKEVGGSIALLSKPGQGTEIVVLMPVKNG
jgi:signal transduction histidine kinase